MDPSDIARLAERFVGMDEDERSRELLALSDDEREAVAAFMETKAAHYQEQGEADLEMAESFRWVAEADYMEVLDRGYRIIDESEQATRPEGLLGVLDRLACADRRAVVSALFALLVERRCSVGMSPPPAIQELYDDWNRYVMQDLQRLREQEQKGGES
jgi:hypothetical protein